MQIIPIDSNLVRLDHLVIVPLKIFDSCQQFFFVPILQLCLYTTPESI